MMTIKSVYGYVWNIDISGSLSEDDKKHIKNFVPMFFFNDCSCITWAFDHKLPSGRWLENMQLLNDTITALIA